MSVKRAKNRASSFLQQLDPCVTFALAQLVEAHSFLSFSPCIELCLSGRPGGRRTQRFAAPVPSSKNKKPLCAHYDLGLCFLNPLHIVLFNYTTSFPSDTLAMQSSSLFPLCPLPQVQMAHQLFLY